MGGGRRQLNLELDIIVTFSTVETWAHNSISFGSSCVIMPSVLFAGIKLLQMLAIVIFFVTDYELLLLEHRRDL